MPIISTKSEEQEGIEFNHSKIDIFHNTTIMKLIVLPLFVGLLIMENTIGAAGEQHMIEDGVSV